MEALIDSVVDSAVNRANCYRRPEDWDRYDREHQAARSNLLALLTVPPPDTKAKVVAVEWIKDAPSGLLTVVTLRGWIQAVGNGDVVIYRRKTSRMPRWASALVEWWLRQWDGGWIKGTP